MLFFKVSVASSCEPTWLFHGFSKLIACNVLHLQGNGQFCRSAAAFCVCVTMEEVDIQGPAGENHRVGQEAVVQTRVGWMPLGSDS